MSLENMFTEFAEGFDYDGVHEDFFSHEVECDDRVPLDHEDTYIAGKARLGSSCYLKCKDGYEFKERVIHLITLGLLINSHGKNFEVVFEMKNHLQG